MEKVNQIEIGWTFIITETSQLVTGSLKCDVFHFLLEIFIKNENGIGICKTNMSRRRCLALAYYILKD